METTSHHWLIPIALLASVIVTVGGAEPETATRTAAVREEPELPQSNRELRKPSTEVEYEREMIEWAHGLFEKAGLRLPPVLIRFHNDEGPCEANMGILRYLADGSPIIRVCADHDEPQVRDHWRRQSLLHELAHAWEMAELDDATRRRFERLRDLNHWNDRAEEWSARATEHAAEIITWGLIDFTWRFVKIPDNSCDDFRIGYEVLTGSQSRTCPARPDG